MWYYMILNGYGKYNWEVTMFYWKRKKTRNKIVVLLCKKKSNWNIFPNSTMKVDETTRRTPSQASQDIQSVADLLLVTCGHVTNYYFFFSFAAFHFSHAHRETPSFFSLFLLREQNLKNPKCSVAAPHGPGPRSFSGDFADRPTNTQTHFSQITLSRVAGLAARQRRLAVFGVRIKLTRVVSQKLCRPTDAQTTVSFSVNCYLLDFVSISILLFWFC